MHMCLLKHVKPRRFGDFTAGRGPAAEVASRSPGDARAARDTRAYAYIEIVEGALYAQERAQVAGYTRIVASLREVALSRAYSREVIRAWLTTLR